jgi:hypothetical protein
MSAKTITTETYWDKYGIPRVTLHEAAWNIELSLKTNQTRGVICLISEAGEGKSQLINQLARKYNRRVVDIRTAQFSLLGAGVPQRANEKTGQFDIAVPSDYPQPGEKAIVLFEEINQGQQHAIAMFFRLLEDRGIYNYKLPDDCLVIAVMNPATAGYNVTKLETNHAFNRRLMKFFVYTPFAEWLEHAKTKDFHYTDGRELPCHPWILRYLQATPNMLYAAKDRDGNKQFACPATWQTVSLHLYNLEASGEPLTSERSLNRIAASVNQVTASTLVEYIRNKAILIGPEEVLTKYKAKGKLRERVLELKSEPGGDYLRLVESVAHYLFNEKPDPDATAPYLVRFWADMPEETMQSFYSQLGAAAEAGSREYTTNNVAYMQRLTRALQTEPLWEALNKQLNETHDAYKRKLQGEREIPDPIT